MSKFFSLSVVALAAAGLMIACGSDGTNQNNETAQTVMVKQASTEVSAECPQGGVKIELGLDTNKNNVLDPAEIIRTEWVCNGKDGTNGTNGTNGKDGKNGADGTNGTNGTDGTDGTNGLNALVVIADEPAGTNCTAGGKKIASGTDTNNNGALDEAEIIKTEYICNGTNGSDGNAGSKGDAGANSIIISTKENPGNNCATGGYKIEVGIDTNGNLSLDEAENPQTFYVCNGKNSVIRSTKENPGTNCVAGGQKIEYGTDDNGNGTLDGDKVTGEVDGEYYVCDESTETNCTITNEIRYLACGDQTGTQKQICNGTSGLWENSGVCSRTYICSNKPEGTLWSSVDSYTQTWSNSAWTPADDQTTDYDPSESTTSCRFKCSTDYVWDGSKCKWIKPLTWTDKSASTMNHAAAITYCQNLGGRLPTIDELRTIIINCDKTVVGGSCQITDPDCLASDTCWSQTTCVCNFSSDGLPHSTLGDDSSTNLWSSSVVSDSTSNAYIAMFDAGNIGLNTRTLNYSVRCVKD